jgi:hypothetical protein
MSSRSVILPQSDGNTVRSKKKLELAVTKNFTWQFVKISIIRCQSQKLG